MKVVDSVKKLFKCSGFALKEETLNTVCIALPNPFRNLGHMLPFFLDFEVGLYIYIYRTAPT